MLDADPFASLQAGRPWGQVGRWPAWWIGCPGSDGSALRAADAPFATAFRLRVRLRRAQSLVMHVSADERYDLLVDGERVGRGPERGDQRHWFFESYRLRLPAGTHTLVARVWTLGDKAAYAQMTVRPGFLLAVDGAHAERFSTGTAPWDAVRLDGYGCLDPTVAWGTGHKSDLDGKLLPWGLETGRGITGWKPAVRMHHAVDGALCNEYERTQQLRPAMLPAQRSEALPAGCIRFIDQPAREDTTAIPVTAADDLSSEHHSWQRLLDGGRVVVPARTSRRIIIDLEAYRCAYPIVTLSGGAGSLVRLGWAEGLYEGTSGHLSGGGEANARAKGDRSVILDKCFIGVSDIFRPDGGRGRRFEPLWWQAGRYLELFVQTGAQPLAFDGFALHATGYPLRKDGAFACDDPRWNAVADAAWATLQACSHETYIDCPYYEQLQYIGDTRLQALVTMTWARDDRLVRKALRMFDASRLPDRGLTCSRYPARVTQIIPPFSMWWLAMVHDHALWRGDREFSSGLMPGARSVLEALLACRDRQGLISALPGWNFTDWVPEWTATTRDVRNWGVPPGAMDSASSVINWQAVGVLRQVAELEDWLGEPELARRWRRHAAELAQRTDRSFWDARRGLYADDKAMRHRSEHAQCLALISGAVPASRRARLAAALHAGDRDTMARATIYFTHYRFEAVHHGGGIDAVFDGLERIWYPLTRTGLLTTSEEPEPARSDCHAWGAHPLYHALTTILGIRPTGLGTGSVTIVPRLGPLGWATGTLVHAAGDITMEVERRGRGLTGTISMPRGLAGELRLGKRRMRLRPGRNDFRH